VFNKVAEDQAAGRPEDVTAVGSRVDAISAELVKVIQEIKNAKKNAADIGDELKLEWLKAKK
jgi:archaellum component FlaC